MMAGDLMNTAAPSLTESHPAADCPDKCPRCGACRHRSGGPDDVPCCNEHCGGEWGTGCYHCHHSRFEAESKSPEESGDLGVGVADHLTTTEPATVPQNPQLADVCRHRHAELRTYLDAIYAAKRDYDRAIDRSFPVGSTVHEQHRGTPLEVCGGAYHGRLRVHNSVTGKRYYMCATRLREFPPREGD